MWRKRTGHRTSSSGREPSSGQEPEAQPESALSSLTQKDPPPGTVSPSPAGSVGLPSTPRASRSPFEVASLIIAPTTLLTALLYYCGWVYTNAGLAYFRVDASVVELTTQDYLLRGIQPIFIPLVVVLAFALGALWAHSVLSRWMRTGRHLRLLAALTPGMALGGLALVGVGIAALLRHPIFGIDRLIPPVSLALGTLGLGYAVYLRKRLKPVRAPGPELFPPGAVWLSLASLVLVVLLIIISLFWAIGDYAQALGEGKAQETAAGLSDRSGVVVYSKQPLDIDPGTGVAEEQLAGRTNYRFRYSGLRLLLRAGRKYILLPANWSRWGPTASVITLPDNEDIRIEFTPGALAVPPAEVLPTRGSETEGDRSLPRQPGEANPPDQRPRREQPSTPGRREGSATDPGFPGSEASAPGPPPDRHPPPGRARGTSMRSPRRIVFNFGGPAGPGPCVASNRASSEPSSIREAATPTCQPLERDGASTEYSIFTMTGGGEAVKPIWRGTGAPTPPAWSPDGTQIAFSTVIGGNRDIVVARADGSGGLSKLTGSPEADFDPAWSPDGKRIAFARGRDPLSQKAGNSDVFVMDADGTKVQRLSEGPAQDENPVWFDEGRILFISRSEGGPYEIYVVNADGSSKTALGDTGIPVVFESEHEGNSEIYAANLDGKGVKNLTRNASKDSDPAWSPDGNRIAFVSDREGNKSRIWTMDATGRNLTLLTGDLEAEAPQWSPDGTRIAFVSGNRIHIMGADGSQQRALTPGAQAEYFPTWSPSSSTRIAFVNAQCESNARNSRCA